MKNENMIPSARESAQHTAIPYEVQDGSANFPICYVVAARPLNDDTVIASCQGPDRAANAAHICRCVNSHDALVSALRRIDDWAKAPGSAPDPAYVARIARAALASL